MSIDISDHVTYKEATKSNTALKNGIDNTPNTTQLNAMRRVAKNVFDPMRKHFNVKIGVSSFFRSKELNKKIGGASKSDHMDGEAMDIDADIYGGVTNRQIFDYIKDNLEFDKLIWEFGSDEEPAWVHVSYVEGNNRKMVMQAIRKDGKTSYVFI